MDNRMETVAVVTRDGMIWVEQGNHPEDNAAIMLHPDQVPLLIKWLQQALAEVSGVVATNADSRRG